LSATSQPRNTLLDNVTGGLMTGRAGGALQNLPNHLKNMVIWNYEQTNTGKRILNFVQQTFGHGAFLIQLLQALLVLLPLLVIKFIISRK
jgi:hypothetical protein